MKYGNKKTQLDGILFDSKAEADRYATLKLIERAGEIEDLTLQPKFVLLPGFNRGKKRIKPMSYKADFQYWDKLLGYWVVEDVKGMQTEAYKIKKKLFLDGFPDLGFREVTRKGIIDYPPYVS